MSYICYLINGQDSKTFYGQPNEVDDFVANLKKKHGMWVMIMRMDA